MRQKNVIFNNTTFYPQHEGNETKEEGIFIREHIAINVLHALIIGKNGSVGDGEAIAKKAVEITDEFMAALMK